MFISNWSCAHEKSDDVAEEFSNELLGVSLSFGDSDFEGVESKMIEMSMGDCLIRLLFLCVFGIGKILSFFIIFGLFLDHNFEIIFCNS